MSGDLVPVRSAAPAETPITKGPEEAFDPRLFEGPAVEESLLAEWRQILGPEWRHEHTHAGALFSFPRSPQAVQFLTGLGWPEVHDGPQPVRNPLALMRPPEIAGYSRYTKDFAGQVYGGGSVPVDDPRRDERRYQMSAYDTNRALDNEKTLRRYASVLHSYDAFALAVATALNLAILADRLAAITKALETGYRAMQPTGYGTQALAIPQGKDLIQAHRWLALVLLSLVDHPDDRVTLLGRLRALEVLRELDPQALTQALSRENGGLCILHIVHRVRLPWSYLPPGSDSDAKIELSTVQQNERLQKVWVRTSQNTTDWAKTANRLIQDAPREAVQIVMLLMQYCDVEGAVTFLQAIPALHRAVIAQMLGERASFRVEHKRAAGASDAVLIGMGLMSDARYETRIDDIGEVELRVFARAQEVRIRDLEEQLALADLAQARLAWTNDDLRSARVHDPKGYYRILGLHPSLFAGRTTDEAEAILTRVWKVIVKERHPDTARPGEDRDRRKEAFQEAERAYAVLSDAAQRALYDRGLL